MSVEEWDSLSPVAPCRVVSIDGGNRVTLLDFLGAIEKAGGKQATRNLLLMRGCAQHLAVARTDGDKPSASVGAGVKRLVIWYRDYYGYLGLFCGFERETSRVAKSLADAKSID